MNLNDLISIDSKQIDNRLPSGNPILKLSEEVKLRNFIFMKNTIIEEELCNQSFDDEKTKIVILTEPKNNHISKGDMNEFREEYLFFIKKYIKKNYRIVHLITNEKWFSVFQELINQYEIPIYSTESVFNNIKKSLTDNNVNIVYNYILSSSFVYYSNNINENILIDLTFSKSNSTKYHLNINEIVKIFSKFNHVLILINNDDYIPEFFDSNVKIIKINQITTSIIQKYSYVYVYHDNPYDYKPLERVMYYALNSKVVITNYNYIINNLLPSVNLLLNNNQYDIVPYDKNIALDIINENRNSILYKQTLLNVLNHICKDILNTSLIKGVNVSSNLDECNDYFKTNSLQHNSYMINYEGVPPHNINKTFMLPKIFLGRNDCDNKFLDHNNIVSKNQNVNNTEKLLSVIVPIHNNGNYLKYKCFNSLLKLSCFNNLELIFIDDGSTDKNTLNIIKEILYKYPDIKYERHENGSGSASRPRNRGVLIASCKYVTFLDPDNEAIDDGFSVLLSEIMSDKKLDMVVGNIVREDNKKRNIINYFSKVWEKNKSDIIFDTRKILIETNLTVQSIQALVVKKDIILNNNLLMVEGAAGQDTLFYQELFLKCQKVKVVNSLIHSYYAYVEGSVTNTVTHKFFEKFYKVEKERIKFLVSQNLIDVYMNVKFNFYFKNWYLKKLMDVSSEIEKEQSKGYLREIIKLYQPYIKSINNLPKI